MRVARLGPAHPLATPAWPAWINGKAARWGARGALEVG